MAYLTLNKSKLKENYLFLKKMFEEKDVSWGVVSKVFCGNRLFLTELIKLGVTEIHDSRISNLAMVKSIGPDIQTVYIKPVAKQNIGKLVKFADVSLNSELKTIEWISEEAVLQEKKHKIIIMVETGDLREGVMGGQLLDFYARVFELPNIEIIGLGTNLNCLNGIMPSADKLIQLCLYKQIIVDCLYIPLMRNHQLPIGVNHFRIGETLYFGMDLVEEKVIEGMHGDVFELHTEIIEMQEKPLVPSGVLAPTPQGEVKEIDERLLGKSSFRAIVDVGVLDVDSKYLIPNDESVELLGASSDMIIINLGENPKNYKVGDVLSFNLKYMGALALMNSDYIDKKLVG